MSIYTKAGSEVYEKMNSLITGYYGDLEECQVKIGVLFAHPNGKTPDRPALTRNGHRTFSKVRIIGLQDRVAGMPDAQIILDGPNWMDDYTTDEQRMELLDRELYCLEIKRGKDKAVQTDDASRPKLKLRKYDYMITGHDSILRRHGKDSLAMREIQELSLHSHSLAQLGSGVQPAPEPVEV